MGNVPPSALRQPPPPPRHSLLVDSNTIPPPPTSKAEEDRSRVRSRPFYFRGGKKADLSNSIIESLPDELLIEILLCLSADEICDNARPVCRRWHHLIHTNAFVCAHLHSTSSGLLLKSLTDLHGPGAPILVTATTQGRVEISELSCRVKFPILCSCNGLALSLRKGQYARKKIPFIFNPATKCAFDLPRFNPGTDRLGMAYAAASMAYKVVGSYHKSGTINCGILTVGVDNARRNVDVKGLSREAMWLVMERPPLITEGFVHWVSETDGVYSYVKNEIFSVSLNVETETFTETRKPDPVLALPEYQESKLRYRCLSTGKYLSLFIYRGAWSWEVWEMKPETWEWRKLLPDIDLEAHKCKIEQLSWEKHDVFVKPVGWVRYPDVLALFVKNLCHSCIIYYLDTDEIDSVELSTTANYHSVVQHRNTLLWSERC